MDSWVRYSVTVYVGLLLAGTLLGGMPAKPMGSAGSGGMVPAAIRSPYPPMLTQPRHITRVTLPSCATATVPLPPA